ncbi:MAG: DUF262 domain-containing protein, partial [Candidatus Electrothrix sp. ATG2]|nr:DUF262 domain-containing protein [Candidatus Electrothrix sp. ATG2]
MAKKNIKISDEMRIKAEEAVTSTAHQVKFNIAEYPVAMYVGRFQSDTGD